MSDATPIHLTGVPVRGLLVDYGGVLTNSVVDVLRDFCLAHGLEGDAFTALMTGEGPRQDMFHQYECGEVTADVFLPQIAGWLGLTRSDIDIMFDHLVPDRAMFEAVGALRSAGVPTTLLSNSWGTELYPRDLLNEVFDHLVISEEVGLRKPEPEIYRFAAGTLSLDPAECVFIDDTAINVEGARAVSMTGIHHTDRASTLGELAGLFGVDLSEYANR